jgi:hypothetical protein
VKITEWQKFYLSRENLIKEKLPKMVPPSFEPETVLR